MPGGEVQVCARAASRDASIASIYGKIMIVLGYANETARSPNTIRDPDSGQKRREAVL